MKKLTIIFLFHIALLTLAACGDETNDESADNKSVAETVNEDVTETDESASSIESEKSDTAEDNEDSPEQSTDTDEDHTTDETGESNSGSKQDDGSLSQYSDQQIEYARVWLQLGANQDIDGLYVKHIPAGTALHPDDETSASYPEDVIQLAGSRLVDGSVTYSGNGDGTINVYNVPLRWDGKYPAGEEFYTEIIENTKLVYVDPGNDEEIIKVINLLQEQD